MNIPCPTNVNCPCDGTPGTNYSSEATDQAVFVSTQFAAVVPPLGNSTWQRLECQMSANNVNSQQAADQAAFQQALMCAEGQVSPYAPDTTAPIESGGGGGTGGGGNTGGGGGGTPSGGGGVTPQVYVNAPQSCTVTCPDNTQFTYTVPAGQFTGASQAAADSAAMNYACQQANQRVICLSALSNSTPTLGVAYTGTITATGNDLATGSNTNQWTLMTGSMPPGLTFNGGALASDSVTITGTPTAVGTYPFTVQITDPQGNTTTKAFSMTVSCSIGFNITTNTANLASGTATSPYDHLYKNTNLAANTTNEFTLNFNTPGSASQTWNWKVILVVPAGSNTTYSLTINGVQQTVTQNGLTLTGSGTFTTSNCTPVTMDVQMRNTVSGGQMTVEWQTP